MMTPALLNAVGAAAPLRVAAGNGGNMHEAATLVRAHLRPKNLRTEEIAGEVDRQHRVPLGKRQRIERTGPQQRGGVDQHVAWTERLLVS
jgi:hypothetical protein